MYYLIEKSPDPKVIGRVYPQAQEAVMHLPHLAPPLDPGKVPWKDSLKQWGDALAENSAFAPPILHKSAKPTDLLSASMYGTFLLVSEKLKGIIVRYKSTDIQFFPVPLITKKNGELPYIIINPVGKGENGHLFRSPIKPSYQFFVTKELKDAIEAEGCTGMEFALRADLAYVRRTN